MTVATYTCRQTVGYLQEGTRGTSAAMLLAACTMLQLRWWQALAVTFVISPVHLQQRRRRYRSASGRSRSVSASPVSLPRTALLSSAASINFAVDPIPSAKPQNCIRANFFDQRVINCRNSLPPHFRGSNCPLARAMDGHIMRWGTIGSCQSAATSQIVKRCWSRVWLM